MMRLISWILIIFFIEGCHFDDKMQYDSMFPMVLVLKNDTQAELTISKIVGSPDAKSSFVLSGKTISPGDTYSFKIPRKVYEDILVGNFILLGICADKENWKVAGTTLTRRKAIDNDQRWSVTVVPVSNCNQRT